MSLIWLPTALCGLELVCVRYTCRYLAVVLVFLCFRRFLCAYVNVLPIDTQKGNNRPQLLRDTDQSLLHYSFPRLFLNKLLALEG